MACAGVACKPERRRKSMRSVCAPHPSKSNGTSPGAQLQSAARLATLPARLSRRRLGPAARGDKHRGSGKRSRSGVQRTHLTAVPPELHACHMRPPASASPSIGPHNRPQHGRPQRDQGHRLALTAQRATAQMYSKMWQCDSAGITRQGSAPRGSPAPACALAGHDPARSGGLGRRHPGTTVAPPHPLSARRQPVSATQML